MHGPPHHTARHLARLIDANINRAREGLRVMEDLARFVLDNHDTTQALKASRHALQSLLEAAAAQGLDRDTLLRHRDVTADVGTTITTPTEGRRDDTASMLAAAAGRATEALRSLEESLKLLGCPAAANTAERLRYQTYTHEKSLAAALDSAACPQWRLCVLITERLCTHHPWQRVVEHAVDAGADCFQLREKDLPAAELVRRATELKRLAQGRAAVIINDRADIALAAHADGVHLGQSDLPAATLRRPDWPCLRVGVSTATIDQARAAVHDHADYCGVGPIYPTTTTHKPVLAGLDYLRQYLADPITRATPHLAIGGITPDNIHHLAAAGCKGVAVSSAICGATNPREACARILSAFA